MPLSFKDGLAHDLANVFHNTNEFAEPVSITRGLFTTPGVAAIVEVREYGVSEEGGVGTAVSSFDFDIIATDYKINGAQVSPVPSDEITVNGSTYRVLPPTENMQCFQPREDGAVLRVHAKKVA